MEVLLISKADTMLNWITLSQMVEPDTLCLSVSLGTTITFSEPLDDFGAFTLDGLHGSQFSSKNSSFSSITPTSGGSPNLSDRQTDVYSSLPSPEILQTDKTERQSSPYAVRKTKLEKSMTETDSDWIPLVVLADGLSPTTADSKTANPKGGKKKQKYELNPDLSQAKKIVSGTNNADRDSHKKALDDKWIKHSLDADWITTAVTFALPDNDKLLPERNIPTWNFSVGDLREAVQSSHHHVYVKLGLLREIAKVEQSLAHFKPTVAVNYTVNEKTEELLKGSMDYVLKRAISYTSDLFAYFNRVCDNSKPEEPTISADLLRVKHSVHVKNCPNCSWLHILFSLDIFKSVEMTYIQFMEISLDVISLIHSVDALV